MPRIRPRLGQLAYIAYGTAVGIGSAVLWLRFLTPDSPLWVAGAAAVSCGMLLVTLTALTHRARRPRAGRRLHARPRPPRKAA